MLALPCTCAGCRERFGERAWTPLIPLLQRSPLPALNALPSPQENLSRGFFWKTEDELYREDYHFHMS